MSMSSCCASDFHNSSLGSESVGDISEAEARQLLGNIEELKDYHKKVILPSLEKAVENPELMRDLFEMEQPRLACKYGRYCINSSRSSCIIDKHMRFLSMYQSNKRLELRVDAMLIKPIQRLTRLLNL